MIGITPQLWAPGVGGIPDTSVALPSVAGRLLRYGHTICATGGFETMTASFRCTVEEGLYWMQQLGASIVVSGPDAQIVWEGCLNQVELRVGAQSRALSLDGVVNRARVRYIGQYGSPFQTAQTSVAASVARYGTRDGTLSLGVSSGSAAQVYRDKELARRAWPKMRPQTSVSTGDRGGEVALVLNGVGWYYALDWVTTSRNDATPEQTTDQVVYLLGQYNATNAFFSTDTRAISASGIYSVPRTIDADTSYRAAIEARLAVGNFNAQRIAYGVYEGRRFVTNEWAGANPTTTTYLSRLNSGRLTTPAGVPVDAWDVRPDAMVEVVDLLDPSPVGGAQDAAARFYCERVTCSVEGEAWGVDLEPEESDALGAVLAARFTKRALR